MACSKYTIYNTLPTILVVSYNRCSDGLWITNYQILPGDVVNLWVLDGTLFGKNLNLVQVNIEQYPPPTNTITPTPTSPCFQIYNGSFEQFTSNVKPPKTIGQYPSIDIPFWDTTNKAITICANGYLKITPYSGDFFAELNSQPQTGQQLYQVFNAVVGQKYTVSFAQRGRLGYSNEMKVGVSGDTSGLVYFPNTYVGSIKNWTLYSEDFIATDPKMSLVFAASNSDPLGNFIDSVSIECNTVTPTPTPSLGFCFSGTVTAELWSYYDCCGNFVSGLTPITDVVCVDVSQPYVRVNVSTNVCSVVCPSPTPTVTPTITDTPTQTPSVTPTNQTPTPTSSVTPTVTPTVSESQTPTPTPTITETPTVTPTPTITESVTPTLTPTNTISPTASLTPTPTETLVPVNCDPIYVDSNGFIYRYSVPTNNFTILSTGSSNSPDVANTNNRIFKTVLVPSPSTQNFYKQYYYNGSIITNVLSDLATSGTSAGLFAINNTTLVNIGFVDCPGTYYGVCPMVYQVDYTDPNNPVYTNKFIPSGPGIPNTWTYGSTIGDFMVTSTNKFLWLNARINLSTGLQQYFLTQYDYTTGNYEQEVELPSTMADSYGLFTWNSEIYISTSGSLYKVDLNFPYSLTFIQNYNSTIFGGVAGCSSDISCNDVNLIPFTGTPTPTPTFSPTPTVTPSGLGSCVTAVYLQITGATNLISGLTCCDETVFTFVDLPVSGIEPTPLFQYCIKNGSLGGYGFNVVSPGVTCIGGGTFPFLDPCPASPTPTPTVTPTLNLCTSFVSPPQTVNGITITESFSGSVTPYTFTPAACCNNTFVAPSGGVWLGNGGGGCPGPVFPFEYTLNFSSPVNDIDLVIYGGGCTGTQEETFTFTTDSGTPVLAIRGVSCHSSISGNTIHQGLGGWTTNDDAPFIKFKVTAPISFTSLTVTGPGGRLGSVLGLCSDSIPAAPTPTPTPTKNYGCAITRVPGNGQSISYPGFTVSGSSTGDVVNILTSANNCGVNVPFDTLGNVVLGKNNQAFSYTLTFDTPINDVVIALGVIDLGESVNVTSNAASTDILGLSGCFYNIVGNNIGSTTSVAYGYFKVSGVTDYTEITMSGFSGQGNGIVVGICTTSFVTPTPTPTLTPTPTSFGSTLFIYIPNL